MKPLLVGEQNPYGADPEFALYPAPDRSAGYRLAVEILGMTRAEYLRAFDRVNLLEGPRWSAPAARAAAERLTHGVRILLGAKVAAAHGIREWVPFRTQTTTTPTVRFCHLLTLPHPSGRCRIWNDPDAVYTARRAVEGFLRLTDCGGA